MWDGSVDRSTCHQSWWSEFDPGTHVKEEENWLLPLDLWPPPVLLTVGLHTKTSFLLCLMPTSNHWRRPKWGKQWKPSVFPFFPWRPLGKRESQCTSRKTAVSTANSWLEAFGGTTHNIYIQDGSTSSFASIQSMLENVGTSHVGMYLKSSLSGHRSW